MCSRACHPAQLAVADDAYLCCDGRRERGSRRPAARCLLQLNLSLGLLLALLAAGSLRRAGASGTPRDQGFLISGSRAFFSPFYKIRGRPHLVNLSRIPIGISSPPPREAHPGSEMARHNHQAVAFLHGRTFLCFYGDPCSGRCEAVPPRDPRHSSGLLQAFGSLLVGLWGLAGSR